MVTVSAELRMRGWKDERKDGGKEEDKEDLIECKLFKDKAGDATIKAKHKPKSLKWEVKY